MRNNDTHIVDDIIRSEVGAIRISQQTEIENIVNEARRKAEINDTKPRPHHRQRFVYGGAALAVAASALFAVLMMTPIREQSDGGSSRKTAPLLAAGSLTTEETTAAEKTMVGMSQALETKTSPIDDGRGFLHVVSTDRFIVNGKPSGHDLIWEDWIGPDGIELAIVFFPDWNGKGEAAQISEYDKIAGKGSTIHTRVISKSGEIIESSTEEVRIGRDVRDEGLHPTPATIASLNKSPESLQEVIDETLEELRSDRLIGQLDEINPEYANLNWTTHQLTHLVTNARTTPEVRSLVFRRLAKVKGARYLGVKKDTLGRRGEAVRIELPAVDLSSIDDTKVADVPTVSASDGAMIIPPRAVEMIMDTAAGKVLEVRELHGGLEVTEHLKPLEELLLPPGTWEVNSIRTFSQQDYQERIESNGAACENYGVACPSTNQTKGQENAKA